MPKKRLFLVGAAVLAAALVVAFIPGPSVKIEIPEGLSAAQTGVLLKEDGVVSSALVFRLCAKLLLVDRDLKPGLYDLRKSMPIPLVVFRLVRGSDGIRVLVPEGFSARQIAERLEANGVCKAYDFLIYIEQNRLEGYLFPSTYFFDAQEKPAEVAKRMQSEFNGKMAPVYNEFKPKPRLTLKQALTLASIVEREAHEPRERTMIAGVYLNRLNKRMRLQADPTVQYVLGYWKTELTSQDLKIKSPYNTYLHYGLPPGPICSPSLNSLMAVLRPADTKALYFVADNKGGHVFSETNAQQIRAKEAFKKGLEKLRDAIRQQKNQLP